MVWVMQELYLIQLIFETDIYEYITFIIIYIYMYNANAIKIIIALGVNPRKAMIINIQHKNIQYKEVGI